MKLHIQYYKSRETNTPHQQGSGHFDSNHSSVCFWVSGYHKLRFILCYSTPFSLDFGLHFTTNENKSTIQSFEFDPGTLLVLDYARTEASFPLTLLHTHHHEGLEELRNPTNPLNYELCVMLSKAVGVATGLGNRLQIAPLLLFSLDWDL